MLLQNDGFRLKYWSVSDKYIQVFEWLNLLSRQVNFCWEYSHCSICEYRIYCVDFGNGANADDWLLKALGGSNKFIRGIFIYNGIHLIAKGLLLGNALGLGLCYIPFQFKPLTQSTRLYMSFVPISWSGQLLECWTFSPSLSVSIVLCYPLW